MTDATHRPKLQFALIEDARRLKITFQPTGVDAAPIAVPLAADEVDGLIRALGKARMQMAEPVKFDPSGTVTAIRKPPIHQLTDPSTGDPVVLIRHPGLGWLSFAFSKEEALQFAESLQQLVRSVRN